MYIYIYLYVYICVCIYIYAIMKTVFPPCYHYNGPVATHTFGPKCMSYHRAIVVITERAHSFHDYIYIMPILPFLNFEHSVCCESLMITYVYMVHSTELF